MPILEMNEQKPQIWSARALKAFSLLKKHKVVFYTIVQLCIFYVVDLRLEVN